MNAEALQALTPILTLSGVIILLMLIVAFLRNHRLTLGLTLLGIAVTVWSTLNVSPLLETDPIAVTGLLVVSRESLLFYLLFLLSAAVVSILAFHSFEQGTAIQPEDSGEKRNKGDFHTRPTFQEEFYLLLLISLLGAIVLVSASHFATLFLGLELMGLALYALIAFPAIHANRNSRSKDQALEAGFKYLVLSALATAFLLFGIALIYAQYGQLQFAAINAAAAAGQGTPVLLAIGLVLLLIGIAFKLSLAPFHFWTPDVYQGAPTPATAYVATVSKGAVIAITLKLFSDIGAFEMRAPMQVFAVLAVTSMLAGNLLALQQENIKRLLAYSSIAHIGYLIVAFLVGRQEFGREAVIYYLVAYIVTTLGAFAVVSLTADYARRANTQSSPYRISFYKGMFWRSPWLATSFTMMLLSLAGIPLTIGFIGKFYIFAAGVQAGYWALLSAVILGSAIGLYYYLRIIVMMVQRPGAVVHDDASSGEVSPGEVSPSAKLTHEGVSIAISGQMVLAVLTVALLAFGIFPQILINWIQ
ncbi:NADH-quinone oxidoreductase subunit N [Biformimicrobium ophioploci]|uniref:NADH-quinone oxidoreductase subunit N n=1 Tax=Biformimicrobium ophioploci TaxID=3036711 RepID=A0ABQ6LX92_9GAMM|nr:NADH-quinone oxidoreductase subunit N [Microbulbifer sp. NKW57]GMG86676.1 NADH-quinone oxidoreductase subunit NuoN [Microbulbifer sp. NKW57]